MESFDVMLETLFADFTCEELLARFRAAGVPCSPINSYSETLADPQVAHMGWVQPVRLLSGVETRTFVSPLRFSGEGFPIYRDPPALGEHSEDVVGADQPVAALARTA